MKHLIPIPYLNGIIYIQGKLENGEVVVDNNSIPTLKGQYCIYKKLKLV